MARDRRAEKVAEWQARFARFERSGTTITQFCLDEGISTPSFFAWRRRLGRKAVGADSRSTARSDSTTRRSRTPPGGVEEVSPEPHQGQFIPVRVRDDVTGPPTTIVAELRGGMRVTISASDCEVLQQTIVALVQADAARAGGDAC